jgi:GntR family transcriptional regulator / MocR family aminotransferase
MPLYVNLDPHSRRTRYRQIFDAIRQSILSGRLPPGTQVPSTRSLAGQLGVARSTVVLAYEHLAAEGYLTGSTGSGSYVARDLPDLRPAPSRPAARPRARSAGRRPVAARADQYASAVIGAPFSNRSTVPFRLGEPAVDLFPVKIWRQLYQRRWRVTPHALMRYGDPAGFRPLRQEIVDYLGAARGVKASVDQVILVRGTQQALDLAARVLLNAGDPVWMEDPGYLSTRATLTAAGARIVPVPVDAEGLVVDEGQRRAPAARAAFVAPSHQYPLGVTMSLPRRLELLDWARRADAWIIEDDFDSEFRYAGQPQLALQGLDTEERVIYLGTFSKTLFPALRLGYMVVPRDLARAFHMGRTLADYLSPTVEQAVVADFLAEGHFARHVRRMRTLYSARQHALVSAAERELGGLLRIEPAAIGMHMVGWLREDTSDRAAFEAALDLGIETPPLSRYCQEVTLPPALLFGYAAVTERTIATAIRRMRPALQSPASRPRAAGGRARRPVTGPGGFTSPRSSRS